MNLDPSQARAVELIRTADMGVVTGGPGTGKTTCLRVALDALEREGATVALAAPTGKAAKRMTEATGRPASTVHRLLAWCPAGWRFHAEHPLDVDVVVVDEASMLDLGLALALFEALGNARLILIGDANQLPSVGPGRVFGDLLRSEALPFVRLEHVHRSASGSWICRNAPLLLEGQLPELRAEPDFTPRLTSSTEEAARMALKEALEDPQSMVLTPQNKGPLGASTLASTIQSVRNPYTAGKGEWTFSNGMRIRLGDSVIQTENNYDLQVMNGEIGTVSGVSNKALSVQFDGGEVHFDRGSVSSLRLAYALTVHRFQGSEVPHAIVICHAAHSYSLSRALLYTAITRAKEKVTLIGDKKGLRAALRTPGGARNTSLHEWLRPPRAEHEARP